MRAGCARARSVVRRGERRDSKSLSVVMANRTAKTPPKDSGSQLISLSPCREGTVGWEVSVTLGPQSSRNAGLQAAL